MSLELVTKFHSLFISLYQWLKFLVKFKWSEMTDLGAWLSNLGFEWNLQKWPTGLVMVTCESPDHDHSSRNCFWRCMHVPVETNSKDLPSNSALQVYTHGCNVHSASFRLLTTKPLTFSYNFWPSPPMFVNKWNFSFQYTKKKHWLVTELGCLNK